MHSPPVWPVVLAGATAFLGLYATQPLLPLFTRVFGASPLAVSLTVTVPGLAVAFAAPLAGRLGDSIGRRRVIVGSATILAVATALAATARTLPELVGWRLVQGLLTPGIFAITIAYIHDRWPAARTGRATGAYVSGTVTGGFVGRATAGIVAAEYSWPSAFLALAVLNAAAAAALWVWLPPEPVTARRDAVTTPVRPLLRLLANRRLVATNAIGFCVLFVQVAMFTYVTFHLAEPPFSLTTAALGWLFVVYLFGAAVTPFAGRWSDIHGHRRALGGGLTIGVCGAVMTLAPWLPAIVLGLTLTATGVFVAQATASSYIGAVTREDRGLAVGLYSSCYYIGGSVGGILPAVLWPAGGWTTTVLLVLTVQVSTYVLAASFWRPAASGHPRPAPDAIG
jgi:MFS family permease